MIRPVLPPHELAKMMLNVYEQYPVLFCSVGILIGLSITGLVFFLIKVARKSPAEHKEGGKE